MTEPIDYPYWVGRLSGFIRIMPKLYDLPENVRKQFIELINEYDKAVKGEEMRANETRGKTYAKTK